MKIYVTRARTIAVVKVKVLSIPNNFNRRKEVQYQFLAAMHEWVLQAFKNLI